MFDSFNLTVSLYVYTYTSIYIKFRKASGIFLRGFITTVVEALQSVSRFGLLDVLAITISTRFSFEYPLRKAFVLEHLLFQENGIELRVFQLLG